MSQDDLVEVARPPFLPMAEEMRLFLEQHDIRVALDHVNSGAMLPHLGTAIGVPVLVAARDAVRASELLEHREPVSHSASGAWFCGACKVDVDAGFDTCWSCGMMRTAVEQPFPEGHDNSPVESAASPEGSSVDRAEDLIRRAWRACIISFGLLPFFGHLYSLALLMESTGQRVEVSPASRKLFFRTLVIDILAMVACGSLFGFLTSRAG